MVDLRSLAVAAVVVGSLVLLFVVSFVLRWVGRILSWSVLLLVALGLGYVAYQLYGGWTDAGDDVTGSADAEGTDDGETAGPPWVDDELSDAELAAELEDAAGESADRARESDSDPEPGS